MRSKTTQRLLELSSGLVRSTVIIALVFASLFSTSQSSHASVSDSNAPQSQTTGLNTLSGPFPTESENKIGIANTEATYTLADVAIHNTQADCWTLVFDKVYNITTYIRNHPGGASSISKICGKDGTSIFDNKHGGSSSQALILSTYKIGVLAKPVVKTCTAGNFYSDALSNCTPAPKGYFVTATSSAAGVNSASACPAGYTTLATGSTQPSDCYKPMAQTITGFSAPKAMKYKAVSYLPITTNTKAMATAKTTGACSAQAVNVVTTVKGKKVTTRKLKVTASTKAGTCKITLTSPAKDKYLAFTKTIQINVSKYGK
jgi:cytochrome b involved in lipid metabolism